MRVCLSPLLPSHHVLVFVPPHTSAHSFSLAPKRKASHILWIYVYVSAIIHIKHIFLGITSFGVFWDVVTIVVFETMT